MKNYIETEIKLKVDDLELLMENLKNKAEFLGEAFQKTIRFDTPDRDLERKGIFLRVRSGFENVITLKKKIETASGVFAREEIEVDIKDIDKMAKILSDLGFNRQWIMEKYRSEWKYNNLILSVDKLPFGDYLEIEGKEDEIEQAAKEFGFNFKNKIISSYWDIFAEYKKQHGIVEENIVFSK